MWTIEKYNIFASTSLVFEFQFKKCSSFHIQKLLSFSAHTNKFALISNITYKNVINWTLSQGNFNVWQCQTWHVYGYHHQSPTPTVGNVPDDTGQLVIFSWIFITYLSFSITWYFKKRIIRIQHAKWFSFLSQAKIRTSKAQIQLSF